MPFLDETQPEELIPQSTFESAPTINEPEQFSAIEAGIAGFERDNLIGAGIDYLRHREKFEAQPGYNPLSDIEGTIYEQDHSDAFIDSRSPAETDHIKQKIDRENKRTEIIANSGTSGMITAMAAGILDPTILLPGGAIYKSYKTGQAVLKSAASVGTAAGVGVAAQEAGLQSVQETRTAEETGTTIATSVLLGGILGAGASKFLSPKQFSDLSRDIDQFSDVMREGEAALIPRPGGAAPADTREARLKDENVMKRLFGLNYQDPMIRGQLKSSRSARRTTNDLAESPLEMAENSEFVPSSPGGSVESRMKTWQGPLSQSVDNLSDQFSKYYYGRQVGGLGRAVAPIRSEISSGGKLTYSEFKQEVGKALRRGDVHSIPEVEHAAKMFRSKVLDPGKQRAIDAGLLDADVDVRTADSYLTRVYNRERIIAKKTEFKRILEEHFQAERVRIRSQFEEAEAKGIEVDEKLAKLAEYTEQEIKSAVDETIDRILGQSPGRTGIDLVQGPRGPLRERVLSIHDTKIEDFLESDIEAVARQYTRTMSADVELAQKFGDVEMGDRLAKVNDDYNQMIDAAKTGKERIRLNKEKLQAISDLEAIRDRLRGTYAIPDNPDGMLVRTGRVIRNLNYLRLLGGMTISAFPDLAKPVFAHGMQRTIRDGIMPMMSNINSFKLAANEVKLAGTALDMTLDTRAMAIADIMDDYGRNTRFERAVTGLSSKFGVVSLMAPWNAAMKQFSGVMIMSRMLRAVNDLKAGKLSQADKRLLAASGIDEAMAREIGEQFATHGRIEDGVYIANTGEWTSQPAVEAFRAAVVRDVDRVVVTPGQDKPLWMSKEWGKMVGQFKSFGVSSVQKTLMAGIQQRDASVFSGAAMMLGLGALTYAMKERVAGREVSTDPAVVSANALDRSGLLGWLADANNIMEKFTGGTVGLSAVTGKQISRYQSRNVTGAFLGPTADMVADTFQLSSAAFKGDMKESDYRKAIRMLPFQNLFYLRLLMEKVD